MVEVVVLQLELVLGRIQPLVPHMELAVEHQLGEYGDGEYYECDGNDCDYGCVNGYECQYRMDDG